MALCARRLAWLRYFTSLVATSPGLSSSPSPLPIPTERRSLQCEVLLHISEYDFPGVDRWMLFSQESTAAKCAIGNSISLLSMLY
jgi:hypothetical protein